MTDKSKNQELDDYLSERFGTCEHTDCHQCKYGENKAFCTEHQHNINNFEIIDAAAKMGYVPRIEWAKMRLIYNKNNLILDLRGGGVAIMWADGIKNHDRQCLEALENGEISIISWVFINHLFGEPVIPKKQKFKIKKNIQKNLIKKYYKKSNTL